MTKQRELQFSREQDAQAFCNGAGTLYPSYRLSPILPKGTRYWRVEVRCAATGAYLTLYKI